VALTLAVRQPNLLGGLILVDTAAASEAMSEVNVLLEQRYGVEAWLAAERMFGGDFSQAALADFMRVVFPAYVYDRTQFWRRRGSRGPLRLQSRNRWVLLQPTRTAVRRAGAAAGGSRPQPGSRRRVRLVDTPSASQTVAAALPDAQLLILPRAGHFSFLEQPEAFMDAVRAFAAPGQPARGQSLRIAVSGTRIPPLM
jgi:pimeloyl-ACP methyl ester carboxylesterase